VAEKSSINTKHPSRIWSFEQEKVFLRLRQFEARLIEVRSVARTIQDFGRLEKLEIGGTRVYHDNQLLIRVLTSGKGRILMAQVDSIYKDFLQMKQQIEEIPFDCLDTNDNRWTEIAHSFWQRIKEHEMRLGYELWVAVS